VPSQSPNESLALHDYAAVVTMSVSIQSKHVLEHHTLGEDKVIAIRMCYDSRTLGFIGRTYL
jgi:predicted SAM-dependent methyltransferase